ncbi:MAG: chemotaxis protein CheB [Polyangiaceae bacterium]
MKRSKRAVPAKGSRSKGEKAPSGSARARPARPARPAQKAAKSQLLPAPWVGTRPAATFPVVGIGASAGGLEALEQFLRKVPADSGMAFVVVQHLDPSHKGVMVELLARAANVPVVQIQDRVRVAPNNVYVIPPNSDLSILHGVLHLLTPAAPRGLHLPIDFFFRSLAEDQRGRAIAVILSGMGTDGTLGLRAIKEKAGACFVQSIRSAKFDGMPSSAIDAGVADVVAPPDELPARIASYIRYAPLGASLRDGAPRAESTEDRNQSALEKVFVLLRAQTGNDFSLYKRTTVLRRIERRMGFLQLDKIAKYVDVLRQNPREVELLFEELLIGVTSFFRDPVSWEQLSQALVPALLSARSDAVLRAWVPGCSTGEEAYSLAMIFREVVGKIRPIKNVTLQIFATDLDRAAVDRARAGVYPPNIAAEVSAERLRRFFVEDERGFRVNKGVREMVVFAQQNVLVDPPFTKLDVLSCRNLLIYLAPELQRRIIPLFHYCLSPGGLLFLGSAETVSGYATLFDSIDGKMRVYRRREVGVEVVPVEFQNVIAHAHAGSGAGRDGAPPERKSSTNIQTLADRLLVQRYVPIGVLCDDKGNILYISGRSGKYLEPVAGKADWNILAMAREGLRHPLTTALRSAQRGDGSVTVRAAKVRTDGGSEIVDVTVEKLVEPEALRGGLLIVFTEVRPSRAPKGAPRGAPRGARVEELERELNRTREETHVVRQEMQTSQEELRSTNEELQSTNEELQSTNEELTTSKEEMQSMNEELQTVNQELQSKVDELSRTNNDMKNLLNSTDIATLFLDGNLNVRRFTTQTSKIIKLIASDAGRPITDIANDMDYPALVDDAREVLRTLAIREVAVPTRDGRWFVVRIMPYRTLDNVIDGLVLTFTDATASKNMERALREQASQLQQMADGLPNLSWSFRADGACDSVGPQWEKFTGKPAADQLGFGWLEVIHPDDRERVRAGWAAAIKAATEFNIEFRIRERNGQYGWFQSRTLPIRDAAGAVVKWYGSSTDISALKASVEPPA